MRVMKKAEAIAGKPYGMVSLFRKCYTPMYVG